MLDTPQEARDYLAEHTARAGAAAGALDSLTLLALAYAAAPSAQQIGAEAVADAPARPSQMALIDRELRARRQSRTFRRGARAHW